MPARRRDDVLLALWTRAASVLRLAGTRTAHAWSRKWRFSAPVMHGTAYDEKRVP